jgi:hypothetical protein
MRRFTVTSGYYVRSPDDLYIPRERHAWRKSEVIGLRQPALLQWNSLALPPGDAVQC